MKEKVEFLIGYLEARFDERQKLLFLEERYGNENVVNALDARCSEIKFIQKELQRIVNSERNEVSNQTK